MIELIPLLMFLVVCLFLMTGYPVAFTLAGTALLFASGGIIFDVFSPQYLGNISGRIWGISTREVLVSVPLFILMGVILEKSRIAEELLNNMARAFKTFPGGLGISVVLVGALMAASTGIVGATVVTLGLISLPTLLKRGYNPSLATGTLCATGTLGQIIPPSIALVLLGSVLSSAHQQASIDMALYDVKLVSVGDLFIGAIVPGLMLVGMYIIYLLAIAIIKPEMCPAVNDADEGESSDKLWIFTSLLPPIILMTIVLGSIIIGAATPTEAAGVGAICALIMALLKRQLSLQQLKEACESTTKITCMVFMILIGASMFSLVFVGFGGDEQIKDFLHTMPGGVLGATLLVMFVMFILGFILDFIEITFIVVPIVGPILLAMGLDPIWLGVMIAINLQTSFLTPPFGFALFYLRGVAPPEIKTVDIYKGVTPFIAIQLLLLIILALYPGLVTWLPDLLKP